MSGAASGIWLLGCGNMGGALLRRWLVAEMELISVIDPLPGALPDGMTASATPPPGMPEILVLAVKPQGWRAAAAPLVPRIGAGSLVVSVMAGVTIAAISEVFPGRPIIRAMPNTPAAIGQGVTGLFTNGNAMVKAAAEAVFQPAGATVWLDSEADFDAVTAVSGSGPAYLFAFIEALAAAGVAEGLEPGLAARLARAAVTGAAALAVADGSPAGVLRDRVTSPGGTTAAGLGVLVPALGPLVRDTVKAAAARSRVLAG